MNPLVIVLIVIVIAGVIALIAFSPMLKKKEDAAAARMRERFGAEFDVYAANTPRFIPALGNRASAV